MAGQPLSWTRVWRRLAAAAAVFVGTLLLVEAIVRFGTYRPIDVISSAPEILYFDARPPLQAGTGGDLIPGQSLWLIDRARPYTVSVNRHGLRNGEEVDPTAFRILALGDSFTFGPYVANDDTWSALLERELRNRRPGWAVQVLNAGMAGYGITQELSYLKSKGLTLQPHLVVLAFYKNDVMDLSPRNRERFARPPDESAPALRDFARRFAVARLGARTLRDVVLARARGHEVRPPTASEVAGYYEEYARRFADLARTVTGAKTRLAVVAFPEYLQVASERCSDRPQRHVERLAAEHRVPFLDLTRELRRYRVEDLYLLAFDATRPARPESCFPDSSRYVGDGHLARFGNQVAARSIAEWLLTQELS